MRSGRAATAVIATVAVAVSAIACDTYHVRLRAGDCVDARIEAVACDDGRAEQRVTDVLRAEGTWKHCVDAASEATFTEGGDGPMIGVTVCLERLAPQAS
jgi:hypothetical protein